MFYAFLKHKAPHVKWRRVQVDGGLDAAMIACIVLAVFALKDGTSPLNLDMLRVTSLVVFVVASVATFRGFQAQSLTREHLIDQTAVTLGGALLWYFAELWRVPPDTNNLLMAVYLNLGIGLFIWGKVATHGPLEVSDQPRQRDEGVEPTAVFDKDAPGYKGPGTPGGPDEEQTPPHYKYGSRASKPEPAGASD